MKDEPRHLARELREWQRLNGLDNRQAAAAIRTGVRTYEGWKKGKGIRKRWHASIALASHTTSIDQFISLFAEREPRLTIFSDFLRANEAIFSTRLASCRHIVEVRTAFPTYPPLSIQYRREYYETARRRILNGDLAVKKIEQVTNLDRAVELAINLATYPITNYHVRLLAPTPWFPALAFTVFDERFVVAGVSHNTVPTEEKLLDFVGRDYADYFLGEWRKMWVAASVEITSADADVQRRILLEHLNRYGELTGERFLSDLTGQEFDRRVEARAATMGSYATRY